VIFLMVFIILNKFEKEKRVIELYLEGKTIHDIAKEVHMSFRDISKIIKTYNKKVRLETKKEEEIKNNQPKKLSTSTQALKLFNDGKQPTEVAIILDLNYESFKTLVSISKIRKKI
jgi:transposase